MKKVCVITGGAGGMGIEIAKAMGKDHYLILDDINESGLNETVNMLTEMGIQAEGVTVDVSDRNAVKQMAKKAAEVGEIASVINTAGLSPHMDTADRIIEVNALGTIYVTEEFLPFMKKDSVLVNISSMAGCYMTPNEAYDKIFDNPSDPNFMGHIMKVLQGMATAASARMEDISYTLSKYFVVRYVKANATRFAKNGARILSFSPGSYDTPMSEVEKAGVERGLKVTPIQRMGHPSEVANVIEFMVSKKASYVTGTDILGDGGCIAAIKIPQL